MPERERIGFMSKRGAELVSPDSYETLANFVIEHVKGVQEDTPFYDLKGFTEIAPNPLSLVLNETSMVVTLDRENKNDPSKRKLVGVGIAIALIKFDASRAPSNLAMSYVIALDKRDKQYKHKNNARDLLIAMRHRVALDGYSGLSRNLPPHTNVSKGKLKDLLS